jgi:hypothetical protein
VAVERPESERPRNREGPALLAALLKDLTARLNDRAALFHPPALLLLLDDAAALLEDLATRLRDLAILHDRAALLLHDRAALLLHDRAALLLRNRTALLLHDRTARLERGTGVRTRRRRRRNVLTDWTRRRTTGGRTFPGRPAVRPRLTAPALLGPAWRRHRHDGRHRSGYRCLLDAEDHNNLRSPDV